MDRSEPTHCGKISTLRASIGKDGKFRKPECEETAVLPSGKTTVIAFAVGTTFKMTCASLKEMKLPVLPVSALAYVGGVNCLRKSFFCLCLGTLATEDVLSQSTPTHQAGVPFIWLAKVAASWCPARLFVQAGDGCLHAPWVQQYLNVPMAIPPPAAFGTNPPPPPTLSLFCAPRPPPGWAVTAPT